MKKLLLFIVLMSLVLSGCTQSDNQNPENSEKQETQYSYSVSTLDEVINNSSNIVVAEIVNIENYKGTTRYQLKILDNIKGETQDNIYLYFDAIDFDINSKWLFFLNYYQHPMEKDLSYIAVTEYNAELSENNELIEFKIFGNDLTEKYLTLDELISSIKNIDDGIMTNKPLVELGAINPTSLEDLVLRSDVIAEIKVSEVTSTGEFGTTAICTFNKVYKGKIKNEGKPVSLHDNVNVGDELLVFLNYNGDDYLNINSSISFVSKEDEKEYDKYLKEILKHNKK